MSGNLLRTAVYANPATSYFALAGSGGGGTTTVNTQTLNCSTINITQDASEYGLTIFSGTGQPANAQIVGESSASFSVGSGGQTLVSFTGEATLNVSTGNGGGIENNVVQIEQRSGTTAGAYIVANQDFGAYVELRHQNELAEEALTDVVGSIQCGGATLLSTMSLQLKDGDGNALATMGFSSNGITSDSITTVVGANITTQQLAGVNTQYRTKMFNTETVDMGTLMPMASIRNSTGGLEYASDSKLAQFGMMTAGSIYMTIPATTFASACNVVLAPYTVFELYTSPIGSGGSTVYNNSSNTYFSTFTAEPYLNGNTFNSYKMFFGN